MDEGDDPSMARFSVEQIDVLMERLSFDRRVSLFNNQDTFVKRSDGRIYLVLV